MLQKGSGRYPGPPDNRDHQLGAHIERLPAPLVKGSKVWANRLVLDQGSEGACVGFSRVQSINSAPHTHHYDNAFAFALYRLAQKLDEWPGEDYEGTSVRVGAKAAQRRGLISAYAFTESVRELATRILNKGPVVIGINWRTGPDNPNFRNNYYIRPMDSELRGGHAICVDGVRWNDDKHDYFRLINSWGRDWSFHGRCRVTREDMEAWLGEQDVAGCTATEVLLWAKKNLRLQNPSTGVTLGVHRRCSFSSSPWRRSSFGSFPR